MYLLLYLLLVGTLSVFTNLNFYAVEPPVNDSYDVRNTLALHSLAEDLLFLVVGSTVVDSVGNTATDVVHIPNDGLS